MCVAILSKNHLSWEITTAQPRLAVVGFDNHSISEAFGLTTVHQPVRELGRRAAQRMLDLVERGPGTPGHEMLRVELVVRSSTGR